MALSQCIKPPNGWYCSRPQGHQGPCASFYDPLEVWSLGQESVRIDTMYCAECDKPSGVDYLCSECRGEMDADTALFVGNLLGALMTVPQSNWPCTTDIEIVTDGAKYTNQIKVTRPSGSYLITVTKM